MKICIPSHKRAATITTHRLVPSATVCVPETQRAAYEAAGCVDVHTHPESIIGLTPKLNWLLDQFAGEDLVFLDDDLEYLCRCFTSKDDAVSRKVTEASIILEIIRETAALARECGAFFFGWESSESTIRYYSGLDPFKFTGFINGCAMGFIAGAGLRFDESVVAKNDYDIGALNAFRHRIWREQRKKDDTKHAPERLFLVHAVLALSRSYKSRVVDNALIVFYEGPREKRAVPDFALDRHTQRGRRLHRGWEHFFTEGVGDKMLPDIYGDRARAIRRDNRLELEG